MQTKEIPTWLVARLPEALKARPPEIIIHPDEIIIWLHINHPLPPPDSDDSRTRQQSIVDLLTNERERTRPLRIKLAKELQKRLGKTISWGMRCEDVEMLFTTRTVPVMTRLGRAERDVLDTLIAAGVADTRSSALAYTVRAFAEEHGAWLDELRQAIARVEQIRSQRIPPTNEGKHL